jgi:hypothetical protein
MLSRALFVLGLTVPAFASGVTTVLTPGGATPNTGGGNSIPFATSFQSEIRYQLVIPAARLLPRPAMLTDIAFAPTATGSINMGELIFSIGHAAPGAPTCNLTTNSNDLTIQHSGPHTYSFTADTWSPFGIPCAFPYDGVSGLLIELRWRNATGAGGVFRTADAGTVLRVYNRLAGGFNATQCSHVVSDGIKLQVTFAQPSVKLGGNPVPGQLLPLTFSAPTDPGRSYYAGASLATAPALGLPAPDLRTIELGLDTLLFLSLIGGPVFPGFSGVFDGFGNAPGGVQLPGSLPPGLAFHVAFLTIEVGFPSGVRSISLTRTVTIP